MQPILRTTALEEERKGGEKGGMVEGMARTKLGTLSL